MNVTINIYGDVHIHCDCCNECGEYDDNFDGGKGIGGVFSSAFFGGDQRGRRRA